MRSLLRTSLLLTSLACAKGAPVSPDAPSASTEVQSVAQVMDRFVEVTGGAAAYEGHSNYFATGNLDIAAQGLSAQVELYMKAPHTKWMSMSMPGLGDIVRYYDGEIGWEINPMLGPRLLTEEEMATESHDSTFNASLHWESLYGEQEFLGAVDFRGESCWKLRVVAADKRERILYFNKESGLMVGLEMTVATDMGDMDIEARLEDYRDLGGVKMPMRTIQTMGPVEVVLQLNHMEWDVSEEPDLSIPEEIKALLSPTPEAAPAE